MQINIKDIITLDDDNKYIVISKINFKGINYYYLVDLNNNNNLMFCYEDKDELVELQDKKLTTKLLPLFFKNINEELNNI